MQQEAMPPTISGALWSQLQLPEEAISAATWLLKQTVTEPAVQWALIPHRDGTPWSHHKSINNDRCSWWLNLILINRFGLISSPSVSALAVKLIVHIKAKRLLFSCCCCFFWPFQLKHFCRKTDTDSWAAKFMPLLSAQRHAVHLYFLIVFDFFSLSLASDFISFLRLLNLIVKLDVLQISQPALSSLSAWAASQINRRKWIIRCDY